MLTKLRAQLSRYDTPPHLLSTSDDGRPHAVAATLDWDGDTLLLSAGKRSLANVAARPRVSVLWAAPGVGEYSLIVDGDAVAGDSDDGRVRVTVTRAVLHRPGAPKTATGSSCGSDCVPLV